MTGNVLVVAGPRSGSHLVAWSVHGALLRDGYSLSFNVPDWVLRRPPPGRHVYTSHADLAHLAGSLRPHTRIVGVERHLAGHLLSYFHTTPLAQFSPVAVCESSFQSARRTMLSVPNEKRVSYDILADPKHPQHGAELERLASIVGIPGPISPAVVPATVPPQDSVNWVGEPRRWATVFSPEFIDELFRLSGEDPTAVRV